jgi:SAM-dependent methyltransferase
LDPQYGNYYRRLYEEHWWWRMRERWVLQAIRRANPGSGWSNILDVGCGDALFFDRLAEFGEVEGIEPDRHLVSEHNPHRSRITIGPFDDSFQPAKRYGLILLLDVLEHLQHPEAALRHVAKLLDSGGNLIITVPAYNLVWTNHDDLNHHFTRYRKSTLFPLLKQSGFAILESAYWFQWTFPVKLSQRALEKAFRIPPSNPPIPGHSLNTLLMHLCAIEHAVLTPIDVPFGTSLFVRCSVSKTNSDSKGPMK